jgi:hypothetical protein
MKETICPSCENEIDPEVCHCGDAIKNHSFLNSNHGPIPMGCTCGYAEPPPKPLKMYILVKASLPSHKMIVVAHGVLMAHKAFSHLMFENTKTYHEWLEKSFRKVVCEVSDGDFERFKQFDDKVIVTESGLDNMEVGMVFCPRQEWPKAFKFLSMSKY